MLTVKKLTQFLISAAVLLVSFSCTSALALNVGTTTASSLNLRKEASTSSASLGTLSKGTKVAVIKNSNGWVQVAVGSKIGYISNKYVVGSKDANFNIGTGAVTGSSVNVRKTPSTSGSVLTKLSKGASVEVVGISSGWYKVKSGSKVGYIHPIYLTITKRAATTTSRSLEKDVSALGNATSDSKLRPDVLEYASKYLGKPYKYGGKGPSSFDCSGFTSYVFKNFGIKLSATASSQYSNTSRVKKSDLLPGDLVFFSNNSSGGRVGHVGIYVGSGKFIHASSPGDDVKYDTLTSGYYNKHYISGGRVIAD